MILFALKDTYLVESLHPLFSKAFDFLRNTDFSLLEDGKYEIDGNRIYAMLQTIKGKDKKDALLECHAEYIDIQMCLSGSLEQMGWKSARYLNNLFLPYDEEKDISFYEDVPNTYLSVYPNHVVVFYPEDAHAPGIGEGIIRKVVVKVKK